ncbi:arylesterase [Paracoccus amoyensis]|uniref:arylesterase n=1 Tax=Paracoccus amoyensis TaxID=2760093 RepID=UPI001FEB7EE8|nr:arylesterase [Paracoccus amoyensis]
MPRLATAQAPTRLLIFGDSLTEGYGLRPGDGLVPRLQDYLDAHNRPTVVLNGGLSGDSTYGGRVRIGWSLTRHRPDAVVIELGGNDMLMGWDVRAAETNLDVILQDARAGGRPVLLVGVHPVDGDAKWRQSWIDLWPRLAERHGALLLPDLYAPLTFAPKDRQRDLVLADGIHPSAKGVELMVQVLGPAVIALLDQK